MVIIILESSKPSPVSVYIMCSVRIQTSEFILRDPRGSSPKGECWYRARRCMAPKQVEVFRTYLQFIILLYIFVGECDRYSIEV
jgi:hypothetical protein